MGNNEGVIWVLIGALVLGIAIFTMGQYFSQSAANNQSAIAYNEQYGMDRVSCDLLSGDYVQRSYYDGWETATPVFPDYQTGTCTNIPT